MTKFPKFVPRVKIDTGFLCNIRCRFCYYLDRHFNHPTEHLKWELRTAKRRGIKDIDFSGGEPTIRKDFVELISYANKLGFRTICVITNGIRFADKSYLKKCKNAGLNEILLSVHGYDKKTHESINQAPGSFEKLLRCAKNAGELNIPLRTNTTVTTLNSDVVKHAKLFSKIRPFHVNFILFNDWNFAKCVADNFAVRYSNIAPKLKKAIDILKKCESVGHINVRYIPFCFMQGYEEYVCNQRQLGYDAYEWEPSTRDLLENGRFKYFLNLAYAAFKYFPIYLLRAKRIGEIPDEMVICACQNGYAKDKKCNQCMYEDICEGLEKSYVKTNGFKELVPRKGKKIKDPIFFRRKLIKYA